MKLFCATARPVLGRMVVLVILGAGVSRAALEVTLAPGNKVGPETTVSVSVDMLPGFTGYSADFTDGFVVRMETLLVFQSAGDPDVSNDTNWTNTFWFFTDTIPGGGAYQDGAMSGEDNWVYVTTEAGEVSWAKVEISQTSFTPILYVHDPVNPTGDITLPEAVAAAPSVRDVQIKTVDFVTGIMELHNFGPGGQGLDGWQFCTHDENQIKQYSGLTGLNGVSIEAGTSLFIHFNNDAPVVANHINRSSIGGSWAEPLDPGPTG